MYIKYPDDKHDDVPDLEGEVWAERLVLQPGHHILRKG